MTTSLLRASGASMEVSAHGRRSEETGELTIFVAVANLGGEPAELTEARLRVPHDYALRIVDMLLTSYLERRFPVPCTIHPVGSATWSVPLCAGQSLIYESAITKGEAPATGPQGTESGTSGQARLSGFLSTRTRAYF
jgi:hypothetical protein